MRFCEAGQSARGNGRVDEHLSREDQCRRLIPTIGPSDRRSQLTTLVVRGSVVDNSPLPLGLAPSPLRWAHGPLPPHPCECPLSPGIVLIYEYASSIVWGWECLECQWRLSTEEAVYVVFARNGSRHARARSILKDSRPQTQPTRDKVDLFIEIQ